MLGTTEYIGRVGIKVMNFESRVSNGTGQCNFLGKRDKLKILPRNGMDRDSLSKSRRGHGGGWGGGEVILSRDASGTEEFVPGFLLLPLSPGTAGQGNIFDLGQRDNGTSRPLENPIWK